MLPDAKEGVTAVKSWFKNVLPPGLLSGLKKQQFVRRYMARSYATSTKRLDICAAEIAGVLHLAGFSHKTPLKGKTCVEVGCGWVLSHSVVFHLLGAKRVYATDIERNAFPTVLSASIRKSIPWVIRDLLGPFEDHDRIRMRQEKLIRIGEFTLENLRKLGIYYWAPVDIARRRLKREVDFVFSNAVLEHVPREDVLPLLMNLTKDLAPEGVMIHCIHLEDHEDTENSPFEFLSEPRKMFTREVQSVRGNRIRASEWMKIFGVVPNMRFTPLYAYVRQNRELPASIHPSVLHEDESDLRVCNLGVLGVKSPDAITTSSR